MALESTSSATRQPVPPVSYITSVWLGMTPADIAQGIADGIIEAPLGWTGTNADASTDEVIRRTLNGSSGSHERTQTDSNASSETPAATRDDVRSIFQSLDAALSAEAFDQIWTRAGDSDQLRSNGLLGYLSRTLLGSEASSAPDSAPTVAALENFMADAEHHGQIVDLVGKTGQELAALAKENSGYRYALLNLDSIAIIGNRELLAAINGNGQLDRFDPDTGEQNFSDAWLADRSKLLAWKLSTEAGGSTTMEGDGAWHFVDHLSVDGSGTPYELDLTSDSGEIATNTVVFGNDSAAGELLRGGSSTDRIYGGGGDDVLRGNAGDDYLEGGRGDDLVMGGVGSDDLAGDQGADELDGGAGNDRLRGDAGDDLLTGGRGDDRLEGGAGQDTYVIDIADGMDTIVDADRQGTIEFDGQSLSGADQPHGNGWLSADGRVRFVFSGDSIEGGTLTISLYRTASSAADAVPDNVTKVTGWRNGDLGIVLGDGSAAALEPVASTAAPSDLGTPGGASNAMHDPGTSGNDGQGITWIDPIDADDTGSESSSAGLTALFDELDSTSNVSSTLVTAESVSAGLRGWAGVQEVPDVSAAPTGAPGSALGLTFQDLTSALMDFHDTGHDLADHGALIPMPAPVPGVIDVLQTGETGLGSTWSEAGVGNRQRRTP